MSTVESIPFDEQQQRAIENKRQGVGCEIEEEDSKRQKTGEVSKHDFDKYDSDDSDEVLKHDFDKYDSDDSDDFGDLSRLIFKGLDLTDSFIPDDIETERICNQVSICSRFQHQAKFCGVPLLELLKVKLIILNADSSPLLSAGKFYGSIETSKSDESPLPISYYSVSKDNAVDIDSLITSVSGKNKIINLDLSGPKPRPPIADLNWLRLKFAFKFGDKYAYGAFRENDDGQLEFDDKYYNYDNDDFDENVTPRHIPFDPIYFTHKRDGCLVKRRLVVYEDDEPLRVAAYYALFMGAYATIVVKILKDGVTSVYGFIHARPCIFSSKIRLLAIQPDHKRKLQASDQTVELTRSIVAVPSFSSLVISAELYDQDNNLIVCGKTFFPASPDKSVMKMELDGKGIDSVEVTLNWQSKMF